MTSKKAHLTRPRSSAPPGEPLSMRERRILMFLALGESMPKVALRVGLSIYGVDWRVRQIKRKLGARNLVHAVFKASTAGILMRVSPSAARRLKQGRAAKVLMPANTQRVAIKPKIDSAMPKDQRRWRNAISRHWTRLVKA